MRCRHACGPSGPIPLIGRTTINPLDPIAHRAAVARSGGQGRRPVFREADTSWDAARPENVSRRQSLALDRSEHDGRLMAHRDGGACAAVPPIMAMLVACVLIVGVLSHAAAEPPSERPPQVAASSDPWAEYVVEAAERFEIPAQWIRAVMAAESGGDASSRSPRGAIGLMQIMPATWAELHARFALGDDPFEPRANILAGAAYLRQMHERYGTVEAMLGAYNASPQRFDAYRKGGRALPAETVRYIAKVTPMIAGVEPNGPSAGRNVELSWQLSPLFVTRASVAGRNDPASADPPSARPSKDPVVVDQSALAPLADGLFVSKPAASGRPR